MDHAEDELGGDIFIYRGGHVPLHVTHVLIDESVNEVEDDAFRDCEHLVKVDTHDGIRRIGRFAFYYCKSLKRINLNSVVEIDESAFNGCVNLESLEFGDRLETIVNCAFESCSSLKHLKLTSITTIGNCAFNDCTSLIDIDFSERLQTIEALAFFGCDCLRRIAIPLKRDLIVYDGINHEYNQFDDCEQLTTVDLVGGIHETVTSLHMARWRTEMIVEINRINQVLPNTPANEKTNVIRQWMELVLDMMDYYRAEHCRYVKEGTTLLELALWKAKLDAKEENAMERESKKAEVDAASARVQKRITCGADIVIKNILPFLQLE